MTELGHKDLSSHVIESAAAVHSALGPGFIQSVFENALSVGLAERRVSFQQQKIIPIGHHGVNVGEDRLGPGRQASELVTCSLPLSFGGFPNS